nr:unnamed protein product [Digitaria exilis]
MASKPGYLTDWPWKNLGNHKVVWLTFALYIIYSCSHGFKYALVAPWATLSTYRFVTGSDLDLLAFLVLPVLLLRLLYAQLWITVSRYHTARSKHRIVNKSLDFDQVDRESNWDDPIILTALVLYGLQAALPMARGLPWWDSRGLAVLFLVHAGPVELLYYWFHRALHHHCLYSRYHSHHHASIVTEPITSVIHPFAEEVAYFAIFVIPLLVTMATGTASAFHILPGADIPTASVGTRHSSRRRDAQVQQRKQSGTQAEVEHQKSVEYLDWIDVGATALVALGAGPPLFPPLKYLMYTPSFHSLHHTQFRTNYSLFMPLYDYMYGTLDASTDHLHERALLRRKSKEEEEHVDVVHLTHLTTPGSIFHQRLGFASLAAAPLAAPAATAWPLVALTSLLGATTFRSEANRLRELNVETWVVPRFTSQTDEQLVCGQGYGELYITRKPNLKTKIVDGTNLAAAAVLHMIPEAANAVLLLANANDKMSYVLSLALCEREIRVRYTHATLKLDTLHMTRTYVRYSAMVWLVGDGLMDEEQGRAHEGVHFVPYSQFPPKIIREDCIYHSTPALLVPETFENLHACENWLPRRVMSAWRAAGIVHALEAWDEHECGGMVTGVDKAWRAALAHGFRPYDR